MQVKRFSAEDVATIRSMAARGAGGKEIAVALKRTAEAIRVKCVAIGIDLRPPKRQWHRLRVLLEPMLNKSIVLAARRRGIRAGDLVRRLLTAIMVHDLVDVILDTKPRAHKVAAVTTNIVHKPPTSLARAPQPDELNHAEVHGDRGSLQSLRLRRVVCFLKHASRANVVGAIGQATAHRRR
jgi:hypothetical protein